MKYFEKKTTSLYRPLSGDRINRPVYYDVACILFLFLTIINDRNIQSCINFSNFNFNVWLHCSCSYDKDHIVRSSCKYRNLQTGIHIDNSNIISLPWDGYGRLVRPGSL